MVVPIPHRYGGDAEGYDPVRQNFNSDCEFAIVKCGRAKKYSVIAQPQS